MVLFLALVAGIWMLGHYAKAPTSARWLMICLLYVAVLGVQVALPEANPLRAALGGSRGEWLALGLLGLAVWVYRLGLGKLRDRVRPENRPKAGPGSAGGSARGSAGGTADRASAETGVERYARHIVLREIGGPGQKCLREARVLVIGAGGLGSPVLQYLGAAGVGTLGVIDDDVVEVANLQRQVIHSDARRGLPKVFSAKAAVEGQNPLVTVRPYNRRFTEEIATDLFDDYDLIVEGTDDIATKYLANRAAFAARKPLIFGALSQWEGQVSLFDPVRGGPCYACLFPVPTAAGVAPSCAEGGVLGPLPGIVGTIMAAEAVKQVTGAGHTLHGRVLVFDALHAEARTMTLRPRPECPVCGG
ncbi:HesA/MoeB/ThiF family protein [Palleronia sp. KMU-117]|uniref:HesA/MoeB/ThiF family protein n=1 Tax=Palleronia sp. KMU-117 TaxID=3434108 RepID=UPI003D747605